MTPSRKPLTIFAPDLCGTSCRPTTGDFESGPGRHGLWELSGAGAHAGFRHVWRAAKRLGLALLIAGCAKGADIDVPKDVCAWHEEAFVNEIGQKLDEKSKDHLRGWFLNKMAAGYSGGMTVADAVAEAKEKGWSVPKAAETDKTVMALKIREIAGMSMLEYAAVARGCETKGPQGSDKSADAD